MTIRLVPITEGSRRGLFAAVDEEGRELAVGTLALDALDERALAPGSFSGVRFSVETSDVPQSPR